MIALIFRDLRIAIRVGGGFGLSLAFFFIIVIFFPFAIGPNLELLSKVAPGTSSPTSRSTKPFEREGYKNT
jgi:heme exporter protein B